MAKRVEKKAPWSELEDTTLIRWVNKTGGKEWVKISEQIPERTAKQCRERYYQQLRPGIERGPWQEWECNLIEDYVERHGKHWAEIARRLNGKRSDNQVKNWWHGKRKYNERNRRQAQSQPQPQSQLPLPTLQQPLPHHTGPVEPPTQLPIHTLSLQQPLPHYTGPFELPSEQPPRRQSLTQYGTLIPTGPCDPPVEPQPPQPQPQLDYPSPVSHCGSPKTYQDTSRENPTEVQDKHLGWANAASDSITSMFRSKSGEFSGLHPPSN